MLTYDISDSLSLNPSKKKRKEMNSSCMSYTFVEIANGFIFKETVCQFYIIWSQALLG